MSTISNLIFNGAEHYITSKYGPRTTISTSAGNTGSFHSGTDYGTNNKKLPQYAIEDGEVISCGKDTAANGYALFVWVKYPRINKKFLHYHLDSIAVKAGQKVKKGTLLGYTGMTGKATGIHLHLGVKDLKTNEYEDPEKLVYTPPVSYLKKGDNSDKVLAYKGLLISLKALGVISQNVDKNGVFGAGTEKATKQVQKAAGLAQDGFAGPLTVAACIDLIEKKIK